MCYNIVDDEERRKKKNQKSNKSFNKGGQKMFDEFDIIEVIVGLGITISSVVAVGVGIYNMIYYANMLD